MIQKNKTADFFKLMIFKSLSELVKPSIIFIYYLFDSLCRKKLIVYKIKCVSILRIFVDQFVETLDGWFKAGMEQHCGIVLQNMYELRVRVVLIAGGFNQ